MVDPESKAPAHSQTLSRGIRLLEILAQAGTPMTIAELATELGVHRSIAYRILRTLEDHSLVLRDDAGRVTPGAGLAILARSVSRDLQTVALPELHRLAEELGMTAFIGVWDRLDCVTLVTVEPPHTGATVAQRPGTRHPLSLGAPGIAIQSAMDPAQWNRLAPGQPYRTEVTAARAAGYALSHDEVIPGLNSMAAPIRIPGGKPAALAVVYIRSELPEAKVGARLAESADKISTLLR
ncbi:DNA-binding IclR family transcriptional regulator [Psychromicrobium silvestre]|uniref:DNA-binding IclR family transcriptional regulator n=1 Tax=Psychromicrobium silvestre TaxID=1645614 RepID=A0A7Y9LSG6_9MICC|nr:IclR family transcriptional regulator [Psychromicrobium silvestre]NYE94757.1 DNA-binding IclR family transcriptional regulator [Psychromicrobium silvestre]